MSCIVRLGKDGRGESQQRTTKVDKKVLRSKADRLRQIDFHFMVDLNVSDRHHAKLYCSSDAYLKLLRPCMRDASNVFPSRVCHDLVSRHDA